MCLSLHHENNNQQQGKNNMVEFASIIEKVHPTGHNYDQNGKSEQKYLMF